MVKSMRVSITFYADDDDDGWGVAIEACERSLAWSPKAVTATTPTQRSIPGWGHNTVDDDCDGAIDEALSAPFSKMLTETARNRRATTDVVPDGYTDNALDRDDTASRCHPVSRKPTGIDDNCDGRADEGVGTALPGLRRRRLRDTSAGIISCWDLTDHATTPELRRHRRRHQSQR